MNTLRQDFEVVEKLGGTVYMDCVEFYESLCNILLFVEKHLPLADDPAVQCMRRFKVEGGADCFLQFIGTLDVSNARKEVAAKDDYQVWFQCTEEVANFHNFERA